MTEAAAEAAGQQQCGLRHTPVPKLRGQAESVDCVLVMMIYNSYHLKKKSNSSRIVVVIVVVVVVV